MRRSKIPLYIAITVGIAASAADALAGSCVTDGTGEMQCPRTVAPGLSRETIVPNGPGRAARSDGSIARACAPDAVCSRSGIALAAVLPSGLARVSTTIDARGGTRIVATNTGQRDVRIRGFGLAEPAVLEPLQGTALDCAPGSAPAGSVEISDAGDWHATELAVACGSTITVR